jgi:hypothetical protein
LSQLISWKRNSWIRDEIMLLIERLV